jgi:hypothetical protein
METGLEQVSFKEIAGKTIKHVFSERSDRELVAVFTDNTFAVIDIDHNYGHPELCLDGDLYPDTYKDEDLIASGLFTQEDINKRNADKRSKEVNDRRAKEDAEYRYFLNLKVKYAVKDASDL